MFPGFSARSRDYGDVAVPVIRLESTTPPLAVRRPRSVERLAHICPAGSQTAAAATSRAIRPQAGGRRRDGSVAGQVSHARTQTGTGTRPGAERGRAGEAAKPPAGAVGSDPC